MNIAKTLVGKATDAGKMKKPYLQLGEKQEGGGVKSTGRHTVKIVSEKTARDNDPITQQPREVLQLIVEENGVEKIWNIPIKDKEGNLHYLIAKVAEVEVGDVVELEMKRHGLKNYIDFVKAGEKNKETINYDEDSQETIGGTKSPETDSDLEGSIGEIPF